ncbi:hypothetical protein AAHE18_05G265400 [Arachis hypogaea]
MLMILITLVWWVIPNQKLHKLKKCGFEGPPPSFPLGNIKDMKRKKSNIIIITTTTISSSSSNLSYGKVFIYWLGTEPFLYIAEAEFLKKMSREVEAKAWGKPYYFRKDRYSMFGEGLVMTESNQWVLHCHVIAPAFNPLKFKAMANMMVESTRKMIERWISQINYGNPEIDVEREIIWKEPKTLETKKIGGEIDKLLITIINERMQSGKSKEDLLGHLLQENHQVVNGEEKNKFSMRELIDECKTFFISGYEITSLSIIWSLLLLAMHEDWQNQLRDEIKEVMGNNGDFGVNVNLLNGLKKIDLIAMYCDATLRRSDANEFKPERFMDDENHGCNHQMGYLPFGFVGRMCVGRNLSFMEYKIVLTRLLSRFRFKVSSSYHHSPTIMLSLGPIHRISLIVQPL